MDMDFQLQLYAIHKNLVDPEALEAVESEQQFILHALQNVKRKTPKSKRPQMKKAKGLDPLDMRLNLQLDSIHSSLVDPKAMEALKEELRALIETQLAMQEQPKYDRSMPEWWRNHGS